DTVKVIGKDVPVSIYELMASKENCDPILNTLATVYESGLENYRQQNWPQALENFQEVLAINPADQPCQMFIQRIENYAKEPPPEGWNGVTEYDYK
ncbi:MAG: tetratricopeptide repeat protein, partial [Desulfobacterales bacterium]|nr:tetratricopeptide repeat protein [Desulfobacterales bacterium]